MLEVSPVPGHSRESEKEREIFCDHASWTTRTTPRRCVSWCQGVALGDAMSVSRAAVRFLLSSVAFGVFLLLADYFVFCWRPVQDRRPLKALADNFTHGVAGGWCWANAVLLLGQPVNYSHVFLEVSMGVLFGSIIDLDHFIEARSLAVEVGINNNNSHVIILLLLLQGLSRKLSRRPFAHNTLLIVLGALVVTFLIRYRLPSSLNRLHLVFIVATLAHHLRDADRRGIWFSPWTSPPIPYKLYILLILLLTFNCLSCSKNSETCLFYSSFSKYY